MSLARIAATAWLRSPADLHAVSVLVGAPHRVLGAVAGPSLVPELTGRLPTPAPLAALLRGLSGRLIVTNPCAAARLPRVVGTLARAALRRALAGDDGHEPTTYSVAATARTRLHDARDAADARRLRALLAELPEPVRDGLAPGGAAWAAAALYEPTTLDVRFVDLPGAPSEPEPHPLVALPRYRLGLVVGAGPLPGAEGWTAVDEAARAAPAVRWPPAAEPVPWFVVRMLVPDTVAARGMDPATLARWGALTGRAGPATPDRYWFAASWERFREPGRLVGCVTPAEIARSRRARPSPPPGASGLAPTLADHALHPGVERGVCVPPGYCLVDCVGELEIGVVRMPG